MAFPNSFADAFGHYNYGGKRKALHCSQFEDT